MQLNLGDGSTAVAAKASDEIAQKYNQDVDELSQVKPGDYIVRANGVEGNSQGIIGELQSKSNLELLVRRPEEVHIRLSMEAPGTGLGVELAKGAGDLLLLAKVGEGPVAAWDAANPGRGVRPGGRTAAVNGQMGHNGAALWDVEAVCEVPRDCDAPAGRRGWQCNGS